jgi:pyruvate dehydrogenase E2 component (dihydrolipoamide acetyltransferase)
VAAELGIDVVTVTGTGPNGRITSEDVVEASRSPRRSAGGPVSAAARQVAHRLGVDVDEVAPSRPGAPVERADVERHVRRLLAAGGATAPPSDLPLLQTPTSTQPMTGIRGTIAQRMHASLQEMAQLTLTTEVVMDTVIAHRSTFDGDPRPSYTDYVVAASARALVDHPVVNSQISGGVLALLPEVHVGLAVALDGGLVVPVVRNADRLDLSALAAETTRLAVAARAGALSIADMEGGTFSVSALGAYGVDAFTPVINPPNTAILGVGRLREGVRFDGDIATKTSVLTLSLTWDHRAFDGVPAALFAASVRQHLENWGAPS